jgi:hypothetical protein
MLTWAIAWGYIKMMLLAIPIYVGVGLCLGIGFDMAHDVYDWGRAKIVSEEGECVYTPPTVAV